MRRQVWSGGLLVAILIALSFPFQPAHAFGPELLQTAQGVGTTYGSGLPRLHCGSTMGTAPFLCSVAFASNVGSGDVIIVGWGGDGQPCRVGDVSAGVTDTLGTSFGVAKISADDAGSLFGAALYSGKTTASGFDNVTISVVHNAGHTDCSMNLWDLSVHSISTATPVHVASNDVSGSASSPYTTSASNALSPGNFAVAFIFGQGGAGSAGTSFNSTLLNFAPGAGAMIGSQYSDTVPSPTNYPVNCTSGNCLSGIATFVEAAMIMPTSAFVIVTATLAQGCGFFTLQCWWYPMLFLGMFDGFFIGAAMAFKFSEKGFAYFILAGSTYASLVEISLGVMNATIPIMFIVVNVAYSFRLDRVIGDLASR